MLVADIVTMVQEAVEDDSFTESQIIGFINKGIGKVATILPMPELMVEQTLVVTAGNRYARLPDDFLSNLIWVYNNETLEVLEIVKTYADFVMRFPARFISGPILRVCARRPILFVHPVPTGNTELFTVYTARPEEVMIGDEIEVIEPTFQEDLLVSFATAECYSLVENGIEGTKVNYNKWMGSFNLAVEEYGEFLGLTEETADFVPNPEKDARYNEPCL